VTKDYKDLHQQIAGDISAAATSASLTSGGKRKRIRLPKSDLPSIVPPGTAVALENVAIGKLNMGDVICVTLGEGPQVRRFVKLKMTAQDTYLLTAHEGSDKKEALPKSALVGRVAEAELGSRKWDPSKENLLKKFWGKLTEYGTHKPFGLG